MSSLLDVCRFTSAAGGITDWTYSSAVTGYQSPAAAGVVNGATYSYRAESADLSQWEVGTGTYNTGTGVLARTTVLFNSSGTTSKINFTAAPQVAIVALAEDIVNYIGSKVGIGNTAPDGVLHVGSVAAASSGSNIVSARNSTGASSVHGFAENSTINLSANGQGMDSFDARMVVSGTATYDHFVSYQSRPVYGSSGVATWGYGVWDQITANGPVTNIASYYASDPVGSGSVTTSYKFYAEAPSKATTGYGFYMPFSNTAGFNAASFALITIGKSGSDYPSIGFNVLYQSTSSTYKRASADYAANIQFGSNAGRIETFTAGTSTAGSSITFTAGPYVANGGTSWTTASDARLKENVQPVDVLSRLDKFRAVSFDWKEGGSSDLGVIAQEMELVFPELVDRANPGQLGVNYDRLGAMALGGVKQLLGVVKSLQDEVAALKANAGL